MTNINVNGQRNYYGYIVIDYLQKHCIGTEEIEKFGIIVSDEKISIPIKNANAVANAVLELQKNHNNYTPNSIRNFVIEKEGKEVFLTKMKSFYE